jgi:hypothetical protein
MAALGCAKSILEKEVLHKNMSSCCQNFFKISVDKHKAISISNRLLTTEPKLHLHQHIKLMGV